MGEFLLSFHPITAEAALKGKMISTARLNQKGYPGEYFKIRDTRFILLDIISMNLYTVLMEFFRLEGFESPEACRSFWEETHPGVWDGTEQVYLHFFARVEGS